MTDDQEYTNQQTWASMAYDLIRAEVLPEAPTQSIVTYGFPHAGDLARGECWLTELSEANASDELKKESSAVIFIHPSQWRDAETVLMVLTHEMIHASGVLGHEGAYGIVASKIGLGASGTQIVGGQMMKIYDAPNDQLSLVLHAIAETLPPFPNAALKPEGAIPMSGGGDSGGAGNGDVFSEPKTFCNGGKDVTKPEKPKKVQKNRQLLHQCRCGSKIRAARKDANAECTLCQTPFLRVETKGVNPHDLAGIGDADA